MKIKEGYILRSVAGNHIVVGVGAASVDFNGMININETGAFLWKIFENGASIDEAAELMIKEYDIDIETAKADVTAFVEKLEAADLIEK